MTTQTNQTPLGAADVLDLRTIVDARLSPDGSRAVYAVSAISADRGEDHLQLAVVDVAGGEPSQLTAAQALDSAPAWLPDGSAVVFHSTRTAQPQIHRADLASREVTQLSDHEHGVSSVGPAVSPVGGEIAFWAPMQPPADRSLPYRVTDGVWRLDGVGRLDQAVMELFVMPATGGPAQQLTDNGAVPAGAQWSPDGTRLLYLSFRPGDRPTYELRLLDLAGGSDTLIWECEFQGFPPAFAWLPDGRIARSTTNLVVPQGEPLEIVVTAAEPGAEEDVRSGGVEGWLLSLLQGDSPFFPLQAPRIVVAPDGGSLFVAAQSGPRFEVWALAVDGPAEARRIASGEQATVVLDASEDGLLLATSTMHEPFDLWAAGHDGGGVRRLTSLNQDRFGPERHFTVRRLDVVGEDGTAVEAWFLAPPGAEGPLPTVVDNHGGPHAAWGHLFVYDVAMLADAGYATLLVNERGSVGYSERFAREIHGDFGNLDVSDIEAAVDAAIAAGLADAAALGVRGVSNGGFLTGWIATHSDRYKAAVVENGAVDLVAQIGADVGYVMFPDWLSGGPRNREGSAVDRLEQSPTSFAERCTTPTLIVQHEQDLRCPPTNSDLLFALLKWAGRAPTEMLRMPTTSHNGSLMLGSPVTRVAENEALLEWFGRYLG